MVVVVVVWVCVVGVVVGFGCWLFVVVCWVVVGLGLVVLWWFGGFLCFCFWGGWCVWWLGGGCVWCCWGGFGLGWLLLWGEFGRWGLGWCFLGWGGCWWFGWWFCFFGWWVWLCLGFFLVFLLLGLLNGRQCPKAPDQRGMCIRHGAQQNLRDLVD
ncbi:hypothetical protein RA277_27670, partial [Pseudomonas syringae pv. tagetis]